MESKFLFLLAADLILLAHLLFVAFVVFGSILIFLGKPLRWNWVRNPWFRIAHLLAIGTVVVQSWFGVNCPFTTWEMALRQQGGDAIYFGAFIAHWIEAILYYRAPSWVFTTSYTVFSAIVIAGWFWVRPRGFARK